jgi:hypothetical protein
MSMLVLGSLDREKMMGNLPILPVVCANSKSKREPALRPYQWFYLSLLQTYVFRFLTLFPDQFYLLPETVQLQDQYAIIGSSPASTKIYRLVLKPYSHFRQTMHI